MQVTGEIYHIYNRTVAKENAFENASNKKRCLSLLQYYRFKHTIRYSQFHILSKESKQEYLTDMSCSQPLVEIFSFMIMPTHYHLLLRQLVKDGVKTYLSNFQNSYAKYYNLKQVRNGSLFQNRFKSRRIVDNEDFLSVSRYIHLNPVVAKLISIEQISSYPWSSLRYYQNVENDDFIEKSLILNHFKTFDNYLNFLLLTPRR